MTFRSVCSDRRRENAGLWEMVLLKLTAGGSHEDWMLEDQCVEVCRRETGATGSLEWGGGGGGEECVLTELITTQLRISHGVTANSLYLSSSPYKATSFTVEQYNKYGIHIKCSLQWSFFTNTLNGSQGLYVCYNQMFIIGDGFSGT